MKKNLLAEVTVPSLPPPPLKDSRKKLIAAIVIVVVAVAAVVGAYLLSRGYNPSNDNSSQANVVGTASSLKFSVSVTHAGVSQGTYTYMAKNAGTANLMIRVDFSDTTGNVFTYIVNGAQQKAWVYSGGQWQDISVSFSSQWDSWNSAWMGYKDNLTGWTGIGDWTYTAPNGDSVRVYEITVNPAFADSLFEPSPE